MLFNQKNQNPRKKSYYPFSKNYPGKRGNAYTIGESTTRKKRDERNNIIFYISMVFLFIIVFIVTCVALKLSRRPISNTAYSPASDFNGVYKAVLMPEEALEGGIAYELFRTELNNANANSVVIDFKAQNGMLNFASKNDTAIKIGAADNSYIHSTEIIEDLKANNYKIIARIYCFEDRIAAARITNAGIREKDTNAVWLDQSAQNDGNPWLNPYSRTASNYLISIIKESVSMGADMVLLSSVCFPSSSRVESAVFTTDEDAKTRNEVLLSFIKEAVRACASTPVAVYMPADKALNGSKLLYDGSIIASDCAYNVIDFRPSALSDSFEFNGNIFKKDSFSENLLIQNAVPSLTDENSESYPNKAIIPIIDDEIYISALENLGVSDYILIKEKD